MASWRPTEITLRQRECERFCIAPVCDCAGPTSGYGLILLDCSWGCYMKWQIPPLNYLRPFEATARLGSTVRAAEELGRTHGAVSRQIKLLEQWLGHRLFSRDCGRLELTENGEEYYNAITHVCDLLDRATSAFFDDGKKNVVRVHSPTVFVGRWLIPRLHRFYRRFPDIEIWLSDFTRHSELTRDLCDVAISLDAGNWPDMETTPFMSEFIFPVCNMATAQQLRNQPLLDGLKLLHANDPVARWPSWLASAGLPCHDTARGPRLSDLENVLRAAANGHGVAIARGQLVIDELAANTLVRPFPHAVRLDDAYWLVRPKYGKIGAPIRAFTSWIREEGQLSTMRLTEALATHLAKTGKATVGQRPSASTARETGGRAAPIGIPGRAEAALAACPAR